MYIVYLYVYITAAFVNTYIQIMTLFTCMSTYILNCELL
jgi:hypothetical protein